MSKYPLVSSFLHLKPEISLSIFALASKKREFESKKNKDI